MTCASLSPCTQAMPIYHPSILTGAIWSQLHIRPWSWQPTEGQHRRSCLGAMAPSAGSLGLRTHTPTPSAKPPWSELAPSLSWCRPRAGPGPSYRTWVDRVFRKELVECPIQGGGCGGRVRGKKHFPYNDTSKKHKEEGKWCYLAIKICEKNWNVLSWRLVSPPHMSRDSIQ